MSIIQATVFTVPAPPVIYVGTNIAKVKGVTATLGLPAGTVAGNMLVALGLMRGNGESVVGDPSGFADQLNVGSGVSAYCSVKASAAGNESNLNFSWSATSEMIMTLASFDDSVFGSAGRAATDTVAGATFPLGGGFTLAITMNRGNAEVPGLPDGWVSLSAGNSIGGQGNRGHRVAYIARTAGTAGSTVFSGDNNDRITCWMNVLPA
jgi:hypothetical protein